MNRDLANEPPRDRFTDAQWARIRIGRCPERGYITPDLPYFCNLPAVPGEVLCDSHMIAYLAAETEPSPAWNDQEARPPAPVSPATVAVLLFAVAASLAIILHLLGVLR